MNRNVPLSRLNLAGRPLGVLAALLAASLFARAAQMPRVSHKDAHPSNAQRSIDPPNIPLVEMGPLPIYQVPVTALNENRAALRPPDEAASDGGMSAGDVGLGSDSEQPSWRLKADLVLVRIEVRDQLAWYVFNLRRDDFIVYEDGNQRPIEYFTRETLDAQSPWIGYTIGYYPLDSTRDGRRRRIKVKVRDGKVRGLKARCLPAFYVLDPEEPPGIPH